MKKGLFITILIGFSISCQDNETVDVNFEKYRYPFDELESGKTFVYQRINSVDETISYKWKKGIIKNGEQAIVSLTHDSIVKHDSAIYSYSDNRKLIEIYRHAYDSSENHLGIIKGDIKETGGFNEKVKYEMEGNWLIESLEVKEIIDTVIAVNNEDVKGIYVPCIQISEQGSSFPGLGNSKIQLESYAIYLEGIGLYQHGTFYNDVWYEFQLKKVE